MAEQTLNVPQLFAIILIVFLGVRWLFKSTSNNGSSSSANGQVQGGRNATGARGRVIDPRQVDQIAQMFPQLSRREIHWDLQRNGGSVTATTERILSGRGLERPPISFQPQPPTNHATASGRSNASSSIPSKPTYPDLITRYNLSSKISPPPSDSSSTGADAGPASKPAGKNVWSQNKNERQQIFQRRREEMILEARRKLQEKEQAKAKGSST